MSERYQKNKNNQINQMITKADDNKAKTTTAQTTPISNIKTITRATTTTTTSTTKRLIYNAENLSVFNRLKLLLLNKCKLLRINVSSNHSPSNTSLKFDFDCQQTLLTASSYSRLRRQAYQVHHEFWKSGQLRWRQEKVDVD